MFIQHSCSCEIKAQTVHLNLVALSLAHWYRSSLLDTTLFITTITSISSYFIDYAIDFNIVKIIDLFYHDTFNVLVWNIFSYKDCKNLMLLLFSLIFKNVIHLNRILCISNKNNHRNIYLIALFFPTYFNLLASVCTSSSGFPFPNSSLSAPLSSSHYKKHIPISTFTTCFQSSFFLLNSEDKMCCFFSFRI